MNNLPLAAGDLDAMRRKVLSLSEDRPGVYRMTDHSGKVIYVGRSKKIRSRLLSYFRTSFPKDKGARILVSAVDIDWDYQPSEFACHLRELRLIKRFVPQFNVQMKRTRRWCLVKISGGEAGKVHVGNKPGGNDVQHFGPFSSAAKVRAGIDVLNDLFALRDCALDMPIVYSEQQDLFGAPVRAACMRYELRTCSGPCAGFVSAPDYRDKLAAAQMFLEGRSIEPLKYVIHQMETASHRKQFERAAGWRKKFEALEWLFAEINRARAAIEGSSFVYIDPGSHGNERAYVIKNALVKASASNPRTPIEHQAFKALINEHIQIEEDRGPLESSSIDEMMLVLSWFRRHPSAIRRTVPFIRWTEQND